MIPGSFDLFLKTGSSQRSYLVLLLRNKSKLPGSWRNNSPHFGQIKPFKIYGTYLIQQILAARSDLQTSKMPSNGNHELRFSAPIIDNRQQHINAHCLPALPTSYSTIPAKRFSTLIEIATQLNSELMPPWLGPHPLSHLPILLLPPIEAANALTNISIASYKNIHCDNFHLSFFYHSLLSK